MRIRWILPILCTVTMSAGCSTLSHDGARVRMTSNPEVVRGCQYLGEAKAASGWNGLMTGNLGPSQVETKLRNETAEKGGNVLHLVQSPGFMNARGTGEVYKCPGGGS